MKTATYEDIQRLRQFCQGYRHKRPNSPIVKGVKIVDSTEHAHLTIDDLEMLVEAARDQLPLRDKMRFHESTPYVYDPATKRIVVRSKVAEQVKAGV